jgi:UDP-N-acetyl-D-mannosaminuronic acid dehydrogenase
MAEFNTICIVGLGYIGLPTAAVFASRGKKVIGVDINSRTLETLHSGNAPIFEPGLQETLTIALQSGNLVVQEQPALADAFIIAVPTPINADKTADLRSVKAACMAIVPWLRSGNLVVLESTSPPRTTVEIVAPILERSGLKAGRDFMLAYSPERVLPGRILTELMENARVIGGVDPISAQAGLDLYATFVRGDILMTDSTTAEMVKLMENTFRDVNIALANEFSRLADRFSVDVWEAITIANLHPRVNILRPGPGVGGHCISVDPWFLVEAAPDLAKLIYTARQVNDSQPEFVLELISRAAGGVKGKQVAALGLSFKPDVDDIRESPAVEVVHLLTKAGAVVKAYEPHKPDPHIPGVKTVSTLEETIKNADVLLLLVGHKQFLQLEPKKLTSLTSARLAVDTVNGWNTHIWTQAGFKLFQLGVGKKD